jgi:hypothetical protein
MASLGTTFDASSVEPMGSYDVLPPAKYLVQVNYSEMRPTRDGRGQYLFLQLEVLEGPCTGRKLLDRLNLVNPNPDAVQIAQRTLSSLCRAVGKMRVANSEELHFIPLIADVRVRPPNGTYGESNSMRYLPRSGSPGGAAGHAAGPTVSTPPVALRPGSTAPSTPVGSSTSATGGLPWKRQA